MWFEQMHPGWQVLLSPMRARLESLESELSHLDNLVPPAKTVMAAFDADPASVRVVILGQDPYPTPGIAVGRAFAAGSSSAPASLRNIFLELRSDVPGEGIPDPTLQGWQQQGVFLLNRHLTTLAGHPGAHFGMGWQDFTDAVLAALINLGHPLALVLWGNQAQQVERALAAEIAAAQERLLILKSVHPSPLSAHRGFFGSRPFSAINAWLVGHGLESIDWYR